MKKDEEWAIKGTKTNISLWSNYPDEDQYAKGRLEGAKEMLYVLKQLDEPEITNPTISKKETVEVPQFVADFIESNKRRGNGLWSVISRINKISDSPLSSNELEIIEWVYGSNVKNVKVDKMYARQEIIARAWLDSYTIKKESEWIVKRENGDYVDYFSGSLYELNISVTSSLDATAPYKFTDKSDADAVAILIDGTVELIEGQRQNE